MLFQAMEMFAGNEELTRDAFTACAQMCASSEDNKEYLLALSPVDVFVSCVEQHPESVALLNAARMCLGYFIKDPNTAVEVVQTQVCVCVCMYVCDISIYVSMGVILSRLER
jgi:hypothetical protein